MTKSLLRLLALPLLLSAPLFADVVVLGSDYFQTLPGSFGTFPGIGTINFVGNPIGPGTTDTIQERLSNATINGPSIPIKVVALSLVCATPVNIMGTLVNVAVTLDPANLANDVGTESIQGTSAGGTWNSSANVFVELTFTDTVGWLSRTSSQKLQ